MTFEEGTRTDRGFAVDDLLHHPELGDIHFSLHVPEAYAGTAEPFALYVHCPGWEGLWFQGVGAHLVEDFAFVASDYVGNMVIATPQLDDWDETSAQKTIALTEWLLARYRIDTERVYLSGYSAGGETISLVLGIRPGLYRRALHMASRWDGEVDVLAAAEVPVRLSIGESDDYYGSAPAMTAAQDLREAYRARGLNEERIDELVVLDVKPASYFRDGGAADQHGGGAALFPHDNDVMGWLFQ